jgi:hypothetical protein
MSHYVAVARSNYFNVRDVDALVDALPDCIELVKGDRPATRGLVALLSRGDGGWPTSIYDEDSDEDVEIDVARIVAAHLVDGSVAILEEVGFEKLRYLVGYATAVNAAGETRTVSLTDLEELAKQLGDQVMPVEG